MCGRSQEDNYIHEVQSGHLRLVQQSEASLCNVNFLLDGSDKYLVFQISFLYPILLQRRQSSTHIRPEKQRARIFTRSSLAHLQPLLWSILTTYS
jgi:hypothetical protein